MMTIVLFPVKLLLKLLLYVLMAVMFAAAFVVGAVSVVLKKPFQIFGVLGIASWIIIMVISRIGEGVPLTAGNAVISLICCLICLLLPSLLSLISAGLAKITGLIHNLAMQVNLF